MLPQNFYFLKWNIKKRHHDLKPLCVTQQQAFNKNPNKSRMTKTIIYMCGSSKKVVRECILYTHTQNIKRYLSSSCGLSLILVFYFLYNFVIRHKMMIFHILATDTVTYKHEKETQTHTHIQRPCSIKAQSIYEEILHILRYSLNNFSSVKETWDVEFRIRREFGSTCGCGCCQGQILFPPV